MWDKISWRHRSKHCTYIFLRKKKSKTWLTYVAKWVCFGTLFFNLIRWIQLYDKKNLTFFDCCYKVLLNSSWKTVIKLAKGSLNNIFQDSFNEILSQQLTHDRFYMSVEMRWNLLFRFSTFYFCSIIIFSKMDTKRELILAYPQWTVWIIHHLYSKDSLYYSHHLQYKMTVPVVVTFQLTNILCGGKKWEFRSKTWKKNNTGKKLRPENTVRSHICHVMHKKFFCSCNYVMPFSFVYIFWNILKLKAYKLFENIDPDLSELFI